MFGGGVTQEEAAAGVKNMCREKSEKQQTASGGYPWAVG